MIASGLAQIEAIDTERAQPLNTARDNKDKHGRLLQGFFKKPQDGMVQCNLVDFTDGRMNDYAQVLHAQGLDFETFFKAFHDLNQWTRDHIPELARAIDKLADQYADQEAPPAPLVCPIDRSADQDRRKASRYSIADLLLYPRTKMITSATTYKARSNSDQTSARPNTAAFAIYWLSTNPGMKIINLHGDIEDLSPVETDAGRVFIIPGTQLTQATNDLIHASMHPVFPDTEGAKRFTLRTFVYLDQDLMDHLAREKSTISDLLLRG
ncbi:hypothetical protein HYT05_01095 [Candidatus Kaiserbacteria bacterium]|nr:hypothetical protein [Candidatus Kaiserbacteria bacterium]